MPRYATDTRARLVREAERLFAERGVHQVTVREITVAAGQRNPSVVHYHFGSMDGLRQEILAAHERPIDVRRGAVLAGLGDAPSTRDLVTTLLLPYSAALASPSGRDFLRIVDQLRSGFAVWERQAPVSPNLVRILRLLRDRNPGLGPEERADRIVAVIVLISGLFAERARAVERRRRGLGPTERFITNLADMIVALLDAPAGAPVSRTAAGRGSAGRRS